MGPRQHRGLRRRPRQRHGLRGVGRRRLGERADGQPGGADGLFAKAITPVRARPRGLGGPRRRPGRGARLVAGLGLDEPTPTELRDLPRQEGDGPAAQPAPAATSRSSTARCCPRRWREVFERATRRRCRTWSAPRTSRCPTSSSSRRAGTPASLRAAIVGDDERAAVAAYGGRAALDQHLISDVLFTEPARHLADEHAADAPTYLYRFSITSPDLQQAARRGAARVRDPVRLRRQRRPAVRRSRVPSALADTISDYWVAFATTGRPTHDGAPAWPAYDRAAAAHGADDGRPSARPGPVDRRGWTPSRRGYEPLGRCSRSSPVGSSIAADSAA